MNFMLQRVKPYFHMLFIKIPVSLFIGSTDTPSAFRKQAAYAPKIKLNSLYCTTKYALEKELITIQFALLATAPLN